MSGNGSWIWRFSVTDRDRPHQGPEGAQPSGLPSRAAKLRRFLRHPALSWFLLVGYSLLIFIQSSLPSIDMGTDLPGMDKVLHLAAYTLMGVLACRALATRPRLETALTLFMAAFAFTLLFGLSDEWHQSFVPSRTADVLDFAADGLGALLGAGFTSRHLRPTGGRGSIFPR